MFLQQFLLLIFSCLAASQRFTLSHSLTNQPITITSTISNTSDSRPYLQLSPPSSRAAIFSFSPSSGNITVISPGNFHNANSSLPASSLMNKNLYLQKPTKYDSLLTPMIGDIGFSLYAFWNTWEISREGYLRIGIWGRKPEDKRWFMCDEDTGELSGRIWHLDFLGNGLLPCKGSSFGLRVSYGSGKGKRKGG
ncbi:hypothetical protein BZA77DRAFT_354722 [Pyronema omphalodes]|nr:hypothetical protein BZA77DRAFT_354722 [Pyronema omphalodes]